MRTPPENKGAGSLFSKGKKSDFYPAEALAKQFSAGDPEALAMLGSSPPSTSTGAVAVAEAAAAAAAERRRAASQGAPAGEGERDEDAAGSSPAPAAAAAEDPITQTPRGAPPTAVSRFLPTTRRIVQFSAGAAAAKPGDRVVYLDGAFDLFHPGHVAALRAARALGDFLLVGVHSDEDVRARRGVGRPIMDLHERALSVLACRFVNEVVIGAPAVLTEDLLTTFNVAVVARGTTTETTAAPGSDGFAFSVPGSATWGRSGGTSGYGGANGSGGGVSRGPSMMSLSAPPSRAPSPVPSGVLEALGVPPSPRSAAAAAAAAAATALDADDAAPSAPEAAAVAAAASEVAAEAAPSSSPAATAEAQLNGGSGSFLSDERRYAVARQRGILREFQSPSTLTAAAVVDRIVAHRAQYERRNAKKAAAEAAYYRESKTYVAEK